MLYAYLERESMTSRFGSPQERVSSLRIRWRCIVEILLGGLLVLGCVDSASAQALPELDKVVTLATAEFQPNAIGGVTSEVVSRRLLTQEELETLALGDQDGDGVPSIRDACPLNAECQTHEDIAAGKTDVLSPFLSLVGSMEEVVQWGLEENQTKELYDQETLINRAAEAGFDPDVVQMWRDEFLPPDPEEPEKCGKCRKRVSKECKADCKDLSPRNRWRCEWRCHKEKKQQCEESCDAKKKKIKARIQKIKKKIHKVIAKPRDQRPPGLLRRLFQSLYRNIVRLWNLIWRW